MRLDSRLALRQEEAAAALGISPRMLRALGSAVPHARIGTRPVYPVELLREWLRRCAQAETERDRRIADAMLENLRGPIEK